MRKSSRVQSMLVVGVVATIVGAVSATIHVGEVVAERPFTISAQETRAVDRWASLGVPVTASGFDFSVPRPLRNVVVNVRTHDVDPGEVVQAYIMGGGLEYRFSARIPDTGNNVTGTFSFLVDSMDLDTMDALFQNTHGQPSVRIVQTHGGGSVRIDSVEIELDW